MKSVGKNWQHRPDRCCQFFALAALVALCVAGFGCSDRTTKDPLPLVESLSVCLATVRRATTTVFTMKG